MGVRVLAAALVVAVACADAASSPRLAFYALLGAIPAVAAAALGLFGAVLDASTPMTRARAALWGAGLALVVVGAAARSSSLPDVPPVADTALLGSLAALCIDAFLAALGEARVARPALGGLLKDA